MNTIHFCQRRGYLEDFMDKFSLVKSNWGLFSHFWQVAPTLAYLFVLKTPISIRYVSELHANRQMYPHLSIYAIIISEVIKMPEFHWNSRKQLKYLNFDDFWDNLRVFRVQNYVISGENDRKHLNINWSVHAFQADANVINLVKHIVKFDL